MYDLCQNQFVQAPLLKQLKDNDRLAGQLFQSVSQEALLEACDWFGELKLEEHLQELPNVNPYFEGFD